MVGSIFPEKLVYQERKYRTTSVNAFVSLFTLNANVLQGFENRKSQQNAGLSCVAPPTVRISNHLLNDLKRIAGIGEWLKIEPYAPISRS